MSGTPFDSTGSSAGNAAGDTAGDTAGDSAGDWTGEWTGTSRRTSLLATLALLAMTATWGSTFFLIHDLLRRIPVLDFLSVRFTIAAVAMFVAAPRTVLRLSPRKRNHALVLGTLYGSAQILQTTGLQHTPASVSGFITGTYVVLTPVLAAAILRTRIPHSTWAAVLLAMLGLGLLTLSGSHIGFGEALTLAAAVLYALHIVGLGAWSTAADAIGMAIVQCIVIAVISTAAALPHGIVLPHRTGDWVSVIYMALVAGALAMLAQTWAQSQLPPTRSAIIMSMEPVFAAFFGVLFGSDALTWRMLVGGAMVFGAMLIVEVVPRRRRRVEAEISHVAR